jgi:hypothetical protein
MGMFESRSQGSLFSASLGFATALGSREEGGGGGAARGHGKSRFGAQGTERGYDRAEAA